MPPVRAILEAATRLEARAVFDAQAKLRLLRRRARRRPGRRRLPAAADDADHLHRRRDRGRAAPAEHDAGDVHQLRQPAGPGRDRRPRRVPPRRRRARRPPRRRHADRAVGERRAARRVRLGAAPGDLDDHRRDRDAAAARAGRRHRRSCRRDPDRRGGRASVRAAAQPPADRARRAFRPRRRDRARLQALRAPQHHARPSRGSRASTAAAAQIAVEIWALSPAAFGRFVSRIPPPLCIGSLELEDGTPRQRLSCRARTCSRAPPTSPASAAGGSTWRAAADSERATIGFGRAPRATVAVSRSGRSGVGGYCVPSTRQPKPATQALSFGPRPKAIWRAKYSSGP